MACQEFQRGVKVRRYGVGAFKYEILWVGEDSGLKRNLLSAMSTINHVDAIGNFLYTST